MRLPNLARCSDKAASICVIFTFSPMPLKLRARPSGRQAIDAAAARRLRRQFAQLARCDAYRSGLRSCRRVRRLRLSEHREHSRSDRSESRGLPHIRQCPAGCQPIASSLRVCPARLAILELVPLAATAGAQRRRSTLGYLAPPPLAQVGPTRRAVRIALPVPAPTPWAPLHAADLATWGDRLSSSENARTPDHDGLGTL